MEHYQKRNFSTKKDDDIYIKQYEFFKNIFNQELVKDELKDNQYIRILAINKEGKAYESYFKDLRSLLDFLNSGYQYQYNLYFNLSLTDGEGGRSNNLRNRTCIAFDFDRKDNPGLDNKEVLNRYNKVDLWYHALIDSGGGYHVYTMIESTDDYNHIGALQKALGTHLNADLNAIKDTQILRVPYTLNHKYEQPRMVNIVYQFTENIRPYSVEGLLRGTGHSLNDSNSRYAVNSHDMPPCIKDIILRGSPTGRRNEDLIKIIVTLRNRNYTERRLWHVVEEWDIKSGYSLDPNHDIEKEFDYIYHNHEHISLDCSTCKNVKKECKTHKMTILKHEGETIKLTEKVGSRLREPKTTNTKHLEANEVFIYSILLINSRRYTTISTIKEELTYKDNQALSDRTIRTALEGLEDKDYILTRRGARNRLEVKPKTIKTDITRTFRVSIAAILEVVKGRITTEDYRVYLFMRQLMNERNRSEAIDTPANEITITQTELADYFKLTDRQIRNILDRLESERVIDVIKQGKSRKNGYTYNRYRLNY